MKLNLLNGEMSSFSDFVETFHEKVSDSWMNLMHLNYVLFYKIELSDCPEIIISYKVKHNLNALNSSNCQ